MLEDDDASKRMNGGQAVGNDQGRAPAHEFCDRLHDGMLGAWIQRAGGFIEKEDRSILEKCARDANALALSDTQMASPLPHGAAESLRHLS